MTASKFFNHVVKPNYDQFVQSPNDLRLLWNAVVSMNTIAEYVALDQLKYASSLQRKHIDDRAACIRKQYPDLENLRVCAETLKHVRKHRGQTLTSTSTGAPDNLDTWEFQVGSTSHDLRQTLNRAFVTVSKFSELK